MSSFPNETLHLRIPNIPTHLAQNVGPMLIQCWSTVYDAGPTLDQHRASVLCLLGNNKGCSPDAGIHSGQRLVFAGILSETKWNRGNLFSYILYHFQWHNYVSPDLSTISFYGRIELNKLAPAYLATFFTVYIVCILYIHLGMTPPVDFVWNAQPILRNSQ